MNEDEDAKIPDADKKTTLYFWYVVDKIKEQLNLRTDENAPIIYTVFLHPTTSDPYKPNTTVEQKILKELEDKNIVSRVEKPSTFEVGEDEFGNPKGGVQFHLQVNTDKFDKTYNNFRKIVERYKRAEKQGNTLTFRTDGNITFVSSQGKIYKTRLGIKTNQYKLLHFLAGNPHKIFDFVELAKHIKDPRFGVLHKSNERRVRDAIQAIKNKLGYKGSGLFESDCGFGLECDVLIKKS